MNRQERPLRMQRRYPSHGRGAVHDSRKSSDELVELLKLAHLSDGRGIEEQLKKRGEEGVTAVTNALLRAHPLLVSKLQTPVGLHRISSAGGVFAIMFAAALGAIALALQRELGPFFIAACLFVFLLGFAVWSTFPAQRPRLSWVGRCLSILERHRSAHSIGGLALFLDDPATAEDARAFLTSLLPLMDAQTYDAMDPSSRRALRGSILCDSARDGAYTIALAAALARVGDVEAIPALERQLDLATCALLEDVRSVVATSIEKLRARKAEMERSATLLHPSEPPDDETVLLHPVANSGQNPDQLLRSVQSGSTPD